MAVVVLGALTSVGVVHAGWAAGRDRLLAVRDALDEAGAPATARVMSIDAAATRYWTGRGGVVLVNDPVATIGEVADAYDIDWLVLDRGAVDTTTRSSTATGRRGSARRSSRTATRPSFGVYPVAQETAE